MKKSIGLCLALWLGGCLTTVAAQEKTSDSPLTLTGTIPLAGVQGRIDHFGFDPKGRLFVSALGNNTEEVLDLSTQRRIHTIAGIPNPQGVVYSPDTNKIFVASTKGKLYIYDGTSFDLITTIDFHGDADNLRYDPATKQVYLGFGEDDDAAIAVIDATTNKRLGEEFKVGAHPESFQLERSGPNIFVNLPDSKQIAVINRKTHVIAKWPLTFGRQFPYGIG
jgi:DNA-binding beta-propeller fold protein YncE